MFFFSFKNDSKQLYLILKKKNDSEECLNFIISIEYKILAWQIVIKIKKILKNYFFVIYWSKSI